ncbi:MAG: hypothetical protein GC145_19030 [Caulobacter sp.]|nr:hypothetical protein [Caulobacter sp.]
MTTPGRAVVGLLIGSFAGAAQTALFFVVNTLVTNWGAGQPESLISLGLGIFVFSLFVWAFGLFTLGAFGWALLHSAGVRGPASAFLFGAVLTAAAGLCLSGMRLSGSVGWFALAGAVVGLVVWGFSYRRPTGAA